MNSKWALGVVMSGFLGLGVSVVQGESSYKLTDDGVTYEFSSVPVNDSNNALMLNAGEVRVIDSSGKLLSFTHYGQSPGCTEGAYPVKRIDIPVKAVRYAKTGQMQKYIMFCGSSGGEHKTVRFYKPGFGFVSAIDFLNGPIEMEVEPRQIATKITYRSHSKFLNRDIDYSLVYDLLSDGVSVYREINKARSASVLKLDARLEPHRGGDIKSQKLMSLMAFAASGEEAKYCSLLGDGGKEGEASMLQEDVESLVGFAFKPKC